MTGMPIYRVVAAVNIAPGHYDGYTPGDPLAPVTSRAGAIGPIVFAIDADGPPAVLDEMWELGNRASDDQQGWHWPVDVRSLSTGDVLIVYPPGYPRVAGPAEAFAVAQVGFIPIAAPASGSWVRLEGTSATSRPATRAGATASSVPAAGRPGSVRDSL